MWNFKVRKRAADKRQPFQPAVLDAKLLRESPERFEEIMAG